MYSLIVMFCGVASSPASGCYTRAVFEFKSEQSCNDFLSSGNRRWGEGFVVAYCVEKK